MSIHRFLTIRAGFAVAALAVLGSSAGTGPPDANAAGSSETQAETAVFSRPTEFTNVHAPFVPGSVHVYTSVERGVTEIEVLTHTDATREFAWNGATVTCCVLDEVEFLGGVLVSRGKRFLAQADDGSVWAFGEVDEFEDDEDDDEDEEEDEDGWVVGLRMAADPERATENQVPALVMPGAPVAGASWTTHDGPADVSVMDVLASDDAVRLPSGRFEDCLRIRGSSADGDRRLIHVAPGVGVVRERSSTERKMLRGSTLVRRR